MTISPKGDEVRMRMEHTTRVRVVHRAIASHELHPPPRRSLITTVPHRHLPAGIVGLRTGLGRSNDPPIVGGDHREFTKVVVVVRRRDWTDDPFSAMPTGNRPGPRLIFWT